MWFDEIPSVDEVTAAFDWPVFIKGSRQTSRHSADVSIVRNADDFARSMNAYAQDPVLHWQQVVCREFVPLRPVAGGMPGKVPCSFEFRTFWWRGRYVGGARYWQEAAPYEWTGDEKSHGLAIAREAVERMAVPFLVIDIAQTEEGDWIVIECNDGQESGYAGVSPFGLWRRIIDEEKRENSQPQ